MKKLDSLEADFQPLVADLITKVNKATGRDWRISDGRRTMVQQRDIYAQGRTKPGKVVSNAKPGQSAHNFGYAVDLWPLDGNGNFDWNADQKLFKVMADIAVSMGLTAGYYFKSFFDMPHVEDKKWKVSQKLWQEGTLNIE